MTNLTQYQSPDGIEILIDTDTGQSFCSIRGYARMANLSPDTIAKRIKRGSKGVDKSLVKSAETLTAGGLQGVALIPEDIIADWIVDDNPTVAKLLLRAGVRMWLHTQAGYQVASNAVAPKRKPLPPMSHETQLAMAQLAYTVACDTNNLRLKIAVGSSLQNALMPPKMDAATQTELLSVTEVCERHGIRLPKGKDSSVGRQIAKQWREEFDSEPATAPKMLANGHRAAEVKIYPENWLEPLLEGIREVFERNANEGRQP